MFKGEFLEYIAPIGEELQHVKVDENRIFLHSDAYLLTHIAEMKVSQNMLDIISNRLQEVKDTMPSDLREQYDKLSDFEKMDMTDSRYAQNLSDRINKTKKFMADMDSKVQELKDSEESKKLSEARKSLNDFIVRLSSPSSVPSSDKD